jgi:hypothetical protein
MKKKIVNPRREKAKLMRAIQSQIDSVDDSIVNLRNKKSELVQQKRTTRLQK